MSLDVEMECVVESLTAGGVHYTKGDRFAAQVSRADKLIRRGAAKKVGVIDRENPEETPVELGSVEETESEEEAVEADEETSSEVDDD